MLGQLVLSGLKLEEHGSIEHPTHLHLITSELTMRYASRLHSKQITLEVGTAHVEGEASVDVTGQEGGQPPGVSPEGYGLGGGHGGYGGGAHAVNFTSGK